MKEKYNSQARVEETRMENYREMREQKLKSVDEILHQISCMDRAVNEKQDRKSTRLNSSHRT